jgi:hypothetical protein
MDAGDLDKKHGYEDDLKALSGKLERLEKRMPMEGSHQRSWQDVAQSIFNLKEFIYIH